MRIIEMATKRNTFFQDPGASTVEMFAPVVADTSAFVDRAIAAYNQWDELGLNDVYGPIETIDKDSTIENRINKIETMLRRHVEQARSPAKTKTTV
jgi:hypothetical protein